MPDLPDHVLSVVDGKHSCTICGWEWKDTPKGKCPGVPRYRWEKWPKHLQTQKEVDAAKMHGQPVGAYYRASRNDFLWLYDPATLTPAPPPKPWKPTHSLHPSRGKSVCYRCNRTWEQEPPEDDECVPGYGWGAWPEHLLTKKQLQDAGYQIGTKLPPVAGCVSRQKSPNGYMYLYDVNLAVKRSEPTPAQVEALAKAKAAAEAKSKCQDCGGKLYGRRERSRQLCDSCDWKQGQQIVMEKCTAWAREMLEHNALILDTETTGLSGEIIQIAIIDTKGEVLLDTLIKPLHPEDILDAGENGISAYDIHGIHPDHLVDAPLFPEVWEKVKQIIIARPVIIYNKDFDLGRLQSDITRHNLQGIKVIAHCAMEWYAKWYGEWSNYFGSYKWQPLNGGHSALSDCHACLDRVKEMAKLEELPAPDDKAALGM